MMKGGTSLPELPSRFHNSPTILGAYSQILRLEKNELAAYHDDRTTRLMHARIVGYFILEAPSDRARLAVAFEVNSCNSDEEKMLAIGQHYFDYYLRAFRMNPKHTPIPSDDDDDDELPRFDTIKAMSTDMVVETPQNYRQAKDNALVRDGFRCVVSGRYDAISVFRNEELELEKAVHDPTVAVSFTKCAHILPELTIKHRYTSSVPDRDGYMIFEELNGPGIHRLENVLTLDQSILTFFNTFRLWFEPVEPYMPNTYKVRAVRPFLIDSRWKTTVVFTTPDPRKLPVPSAEYLTLHATCCRVANLSGAGDYIDGLLREMEALSQDGTSAEVLQNALWPFNRQIAVH